MATQAAGSDFTNNLGRVYATYTGGFLGFVLLLASSRAPAKQPAVSS